jgi:hypothetical protein
MKSWRSPDELLATREHLPADIRFEYVYDGGKYEDDVLMLKRALAEERSKNATLSETVAA